MLNAKGMVATVSARGTQRNHVQAASQEVQARRGLWLTCAADWQHQCPHSLDSCTWQQGWLLSCLDGRLCQYWLLCSWLVWEFLYVYFSFDSGNWRHLSWWAVVLSPGEGGGRNWGPRKEGAVREDELAPPRWVAASPLAHPWEEQKRTGRHLTICGDYLETHLGVWFFSLLDTTNLCCSVYLASFWGPER